MSASAVIVLAAGSSSRLGRPKQLLCSGSAPLILTTCLTALDAALGPVIVVLGAHAAEIAGKLRRLRLTIVVNDHWYEGMASSIRAGVGAVPADCDGCVLMTCDQPAVTSAHLRSLASAGGRSEAGIAASRYAGTEGVPAWFHRAHFGELAALSGDHGAKPLISGKLGVALVELPAGEQDIDRPADASSFDLH